VERAKELNVPQLMKLVNEGYDIVAPVSSCVLMFKQELPLMFPDDADIQKLKSHIYDPFEYLSLRNKGGKLNTNFKHSLGKVAYHVACHQRVQNIGMKTREILSLIPDTEVKAIERCSGHDGTYAVKKEYHSASMKIGHPVVKKVKQLEADYYSSDCPMAGHQIENGLQDGSEPTHPLSLMRKAYDI
ncbi:MAG: Fe-S oxidoreductase, partial [Gammaproteobacteria bacterium]|nr:Fe-S oxidoreductase [Gammaproteobacteria bacterium]